MASEIGHPEAAGKTPHQRLCELLATVTPEARARIDRRLNDPNYVPPPVEWRDDPDPFGRDWDWLKDVVDEGD